MVNEAGRRVFVERDGALDTVAGRTLEGTTPHRGHQELAGAYEHEFRSSVQIEHSDRAFRSSIQIERS
jgi:hypothetical protein